MRFSTIAISGVMAALSVSAQSTTESGGPSGTLTPVQATQAACLAACPPTSPTCRDACIVDPVGVPNPAIACITNTCTQGNGTAAENLAFENCQKACRASAISVTATTDARPGVTSAPGAGTTSASGAGVTSSGSAASSGDSSAASSGASVRSSGSSGATQPTSTTSGGAGVATTSAGAAATSSSAANAENVKFGMSAVGAFGVFAAIFAL